MESDRILEQKRQMMLDEQARRLEQEREIRNSYTQFYYDSTGNIDFGIPSDENARAYKTYDNMPNLRDPDSQIDFGIPTQDIANMEAAIMAEKKAERDARFEQKRKELIDSVPTQYEENVETKAVDLSNVVSGDASWAFNKLPSLLNMPDTEEYTQYMAGYLEMLKEKPDYYNRIFSILLHKFAPIKEKSLKHDSLQKYERQSLFNSIKMFAMIVEKGYPIDYSLFNEVETPCKVADYISTETVPYDVVIQQMIEVVDKKSDVIGDEVTNPINIISSTTGEERMKATDLGRLALKAHYTHHKLSDDVMHFPNNMVVSADPMQQFTEAREEQLKQDQEIRNQQLQPILQENEMQKGPSLK